MVWPSPSLSTLNGMALVHTWHFNRDGDAPWKNHQDGWLLPHSEAKPFCLAESPPTAHWAHETWGTGPACIKYTGTSHSNHSYKAGRDSDGLLLSCLETQDWGTKVAWMAHHGDEIFPSLCDTVSQSAPCFRLPSTKSNSDTEHGSEFPISFLLAILIDNKCSFFQWTSSLEKQFESF